MTVPKGVPKPQAKFLVDMDAANRLFGAAVGSGLLAETMLPLLGYLTGRRLGLLAFLQGRTFGSTTGCGSSPRGTWFAMAREHGARCPTGRAKA